MLSFRPLDLARDWATSRSFVVDAFMESFGNLDRLVESEDFERAWIEGLMEKHPDSCVHAWLDDAIVGELRMTTQLRDPGERTPDAPRAGYIFFIYVVPELRGSLCVPEASSIATPQAASIATPQASSIATPQAASIATPQASSIATPQASSIASQLHQYAIEFFRRQRVTTVRLSVSPTNLRANRFYAKHGWRDLGPRPDAPHVHLRELTIV